MKKFIKNNIIGFILGAILFSGVTYAATARFASGDVAYDNSGSGLTATNVKSAVDELYSIYNSGTASEDDILSGKTAWSGGSLKSGKIAKPSTVTGNIYAGDAGYLNGNASLTTSTSLTLSTYLSNNSYNFKIGGKEQITFPAGYYKYPINISNGGGGKIDISSFTEVSTKTKYQITETGVYLVLGVNADETHNQGYPTTPVNISVQRVGETAYTNIPEESYITSKTMKQKQWESAGTERYIRGSGRVALLELNAGDYVTTNGGISVVKIN